MMRGYCDTDTLFHNTKRHADQSEVKTEFGCSHGAAG